MNNAITNPPAKPSRLRRVLFTLACLATLVALFYAEEDWRGWHAWSQYRHQLATQGESFDPASVVPSSVPADQNFALTPLVASCYRRLIDENGHEVQPRNTNVTDRFTMRFDDQNNPTTNHLTDWTLGRRTDLAGLRDYYRNRAAKSKFYPVPAQPRSPAADVLLALSPYDATVEELRQAAQLPYARFPLEYGKENPANILLPHLSPMRKAAELLSLRATAELQTGHSDQALADIQLGHYLAGALHHEPILISQLVRIAMLQAVLQPVWEGLADHRWSEPQLVALEDTLAQDDGLADYQLAIHGEIAFDTGLIRYFHHHPEEFYKLLHELTDSNGNGNDGFDNHPSGLQSIAYYLLKTHPIPAGWYYQNQLVCVRLLENHLAAADLPGHTLSPALTRQADAAAEQTQTYPSLFNILARMIAPAIGPTARKFANNQSSLDLARIAIALERYRLTHGQFPDTLAVLAPQYLPSVPNDVINGQPLHYRLAADGRFVLYSVGWNETDDGGTVAYRNKSTTQIDLVQGDWVWRYPSP